jgi:hypothetical protein
MGRLVPLRAGRPPGPDHRKVHAYNSAYGDEIDGNGHGTHVVSSILGKELGGGGLGTPGDCLLFSIKSSFFILFFAF